MLEAGGRMAFIVSADICEGVFARVLWNWVAAHYRLDGVITFDPDAAPFPGVDTNAVIFLLTNEEPSRKFVWARVHRADAAELTATLRALDSCESSASITIARRDVQEGIQTGLSRPEHRASGDFVRLGAIAHVMRGIATGANEFFLMTSAQVRDRNLPEGMFVRCIGRTRDCPFDRMTEQRLNDLDSEGRPTWLLDIPDVPVEQLPEAVRRYLEIGDAAKLPDRALIKMRRRWYRMEQRKVPPLLFAYLGRRACRFIRKVASRGVVYES